MQHAHYMPTLYTLCLYVQYMCQWLYIHTYVCTYIHTIVHWYMFFLILNRCCLWASLAKISRKHEVWDVSLVASRYCLLYNDGRWDFPGMQSLKVESLTVPSKTSAVSQSSLSGRVPSGVPSPKNPSTSSLKEKSQKSLQDSSVASTTAKSVASSEQETKERKTGSGDREMLRLLSTVTCLHGDVRTSLEGMGYLFSCLFLHSILSMLGRPLNQIHRLMNIQLICHILENKLWWINKISLYA